MLERWSNTFPIYLAESMSVTANIAAKVDGVLNLMAMLGRNDRGARLMVIAYDRPTRIDGASDRSKQEQEQFDVQQYLDDEVSPDRRNSIRPGPDGNLPPDVLIDIDGREVRIEATQLHLPLPITEARGQSTIGRWAIFDQLRDYLLTHSPKLQARMRQHRGMLVTVSFGAHDETGKNRLPPRLSSMQTTISHLSTVTPPPGMNDVWRENSVETVIYNSDKTIGCSWSPLPPRYSSSMVTALGFEIALAYHETHTETGIREELVRLVSQHDSPESDLLLVTVNAPVRGGLYFPSSSVLARFVREDPNPLAHYNLKHLKAVVLHDQTEKTSSVLAGKLPW